MHSRASRLLADAFLNYNPTVQKKQRENWAYCADRVDRRLQNTPKHPDLWSRILQKNDDPESLTMEEQFLFMTAGTETIATALSATTFYLPSNPRYLEKLTGEIRSRFPSSESMTLEGLASIEYLQAVIQEGVRIRSSQSSSKCLINLKTAPSTPTAANCAASRDTQRWGADLRRAHPRRHRRGHSLLVHSHTRAVLCGGSRVPPAAVAWRSRVSKRLEMVKPFLMGPMDCIGKVRRNVQTCRPDADLNCSRTLQCTNFDW